MGTNQSLAKLTADTTLSQLISVEPEAAHMLASIGLKPSEYENETLRSVCKQRQWSEVEILQWIKKHSPDHNGSANKEDSHQEPDFGNNLAERYNYLEEEFHAHNLELLKEISQDFPRVVQIHGNQYSWLKNMKWYFETFEENLRLYIRFEQEKLFKLIEKLEKARGNVLDGTIRELERCLKIINEDQKRLQDSMKKLRGKGRAFENPSGACSTLRILHQNFKMLYSGLYEQFIMEKEIILPLVQKKLDAT